MAVTKTYTLKSGVNVGYWVLQYVHIDYVSGTAVASLNGYVDQAAYTAQKAKVMESNVGPVDVSGLAAYTAILTAVQTAFSAKVDVEA